MIVGCCDRWLLYVIGVGVDICIDCCKIFLIMMIG